MKIGIGLPNQVRNVRACVIPGWASQAEQSGFSTLGTLGRIAYPGVMDTVALAAAAGATHSIGLISNVLLATVWPATMLAKEVASIDGISGGRLSLGLGIGGRADDFVGDGLATRGLGSRLDRQLEVFHDIWTGKPVGGGSNPAVPAGTREVPLLFGGFAPAAFERMARWGQGYVGGSLPAAAVSGMFQQARSAWAKAGRQGSPRLIAIAYFALGDTDTARSNIRDYYSVTPEFADAVASAVLVSRAAIKDAVKAFEDIGSDELIISPALDDVQEVERLAEIVL